MQIPNECTDVNVEAWQEPPIYVCARQLPHRVGIGGISGCWSHMVSGKRWSLVKATPFVHSINNNIKLYFSFITLLLSLAINVNVSDPTKDTAPRSGQLNVCMCMYNVRTHINTRTHTHWCMYVCVCVRVHVSAYRGMCVGDGIHQLQLQLGQQ